ncbi:MAG: hypothetical protein JJ902_14625 [Roseibium sp.]|nr:hypothetical protein [Roseibium sp.]
MKSSRCRHRSRVNDWRDRVEYRLLVALSFVICLAMVTVRRMASVLRGRPRSETGQGVVAEAWSAAHATAGYAFLA